MRKDIEQDDVGRLIRKMMPVLNGEEAALVIPVMIELLGQAIALLPDPDAVIDDVPDTLRQRVGELNRSAATA